MNANTTTCKYGKCLDAICEASDSNKTTAKCWCAECGEVRAEIRAAKYTVTVNR